MLRVDDGIRYARNGGVAIAYQVVGEAQVDLVFVPAYGSNLVYGGSGRGGGPFTSALPARFG